MSLATRRAVLVIAPLRTTSSGLFGIRGPHIIADSGRRRHRPRSRHLERRGSAPEQSRSPAGLLFDMSSQFRELMSRNRAPPMPEFITTLRRVFGPGVGEKHGHIFHIRNARLTAGQNKAVLAWLAVGRAVVDMLTPVSVFKACWSIRVIDGCGNAGKDNHLGLLEIAGQIKRSRIIGRAIDALVRRISQCRRACRQSSSVV